LKRKNSKGKKENIILTLGTKRTGGMITWRCNRKRKMMKRRSKKAHCSKNGTRCKRRRGTSHLPVSIPMLVPFASATRVDMSGHSKSLRIELASFLN